MLQMPPHINNSLQLSVKQLKSNSNGQQFNTLSNFNQQEEQQEPFGITNLSNSSSSISNQQNTNINSINNQQQQQQQENLITPPPIYQTSISLNFLVDELENFIETSTTNNLNQSLGDEESIEDDISDLESNLSMDGSMRNDSLITSSNINTSTLNNNNNTHMIISNQFDIYPGSSHSDLANQMHDHQSLFLNVKPEFDSTQAMYANYEQQTDYYTYNSHMNHMNSSHLLGSNETDYLTSLNPIHNNTTNYNLNPIIKKEQDEHTNSSTNSFNSIGADNYLLNKTSTTSSSHKHSLRNEKRYGPIVVRPRKNPAPTLRTGRKSKYIELSPEEERRRELRRCRNRQAAEKCKQKRSEIEDKLENDLKMLLNEKTCIENERVKLLEMKAKLEKLLKQHTDSCQYMSSSSSSNNNNNNYQCKSVTQVYSSNTTNGTNGSAATQFNSNTTSLTQQQYTTLNTTNNQPTTNANSTSNNSNYNYQMNQIQAPYDQYSQQQNMNNSTRLTTHTNKQNHLTSFTSYDNI